MGDISGGLAQARKALAIEQALSEAEPANAETRTKLLFFYDAIGEIEKKSSDYAAALVTDQKALTLLELWAGSDPDLMMFRRLPALENTNLARAHETAAVDRKSSIQKQQAHWRAAQERYQRSLTVWQDLHAKGRLSAEDEIAVAELAKAIAKCDLALSHR